MEEAEEKTEAYLHLCELVEVGELIYI